MEYQVLARKYRPKKLSELIGQDVLVRTLTNAITQERIPQAVVLTGIRGVGKTSTARIIARSLLCTGADEKNEKPTVEPCGVCANCKSISADNHVDVIEVDAASRTGVDDIREIIDQVAYAPVMGRYKIYIIDEVHMLSKQAFNALLKTLEEPPASVKFIFATTEVRKIPVTILSRCMRFDLPRVKTEKLVEHFSNIAKIEGANIDEDALKLIANCAEGSVRDGLSLLDQAIAISNRQQISFESVREMLGLTERDKLFTLAENIIDQKFDEAIALVNELYALGAEGQQIVNDLLKITHELTLFKAAEKLFEKNMLPEFEQKKIKQIIDKTDISRLTRIYQIFSNSLNDLRVISNSIYIAEMAVVKACYASSLPTPEEILEKMNSGNVQEEAPKQIKPQENDLFGAPVQYDSEEAENNIIDFSAQKKTLV